MLLGFRLRSLVLPLLLLGAALVAPARADAPNLDEARQRLDHLKHLLGRSRSVSEEILDALDQVEASYVALAATVTPETESDVGRWRKGAESLYLKAFVLVKPDRTDRKHNLREMVNVHAAGILGRTGNQALWKDIRRLLVTRHFKGRYDVSRQVLESAFDAIAALGDPEALAWMTDEFIHTNSSPEKVVDRLVAAQQAFVKFPLEKIPGRQRHAIVKRLVQLYPATETLANQSGTTAAVQSARRFWDRIRTGVILVAQHFAGTPRNADGEALATMQEFARWFRDHKNPHREPWTDPAPTRG